MYGGKVTENRSIIQIFVFGKSDFYAAAKLLPRKSSGFFFLRFFPRKNLLLQKLKNIKENKKLLIIAMLFVTPGLLNYNYHVNTNEGGTKDCEEFHYEEAWNVPDDSVQPAKCNLAGNRDMGRQK